MNREGPPQSDSEASGPGAVLRASGVPLDLAGRVERFLPEANPVSAIRLWLGPDFATSPDFDKAKIVRRLNHDVALIDALLSDQVNAILHHEDFQRLESAWRGLVFLTEQAEDIDGIKIKVLNAPWADVSRDITRAMEFDQSQLFKKVYTDEFGTPGGEPIGLLIGDYEVEHQPSRSHPSDDIPILQGLAQVAAAAFSPLIIGVGPGILGLERFAELEHPINLQAVFGQPEYARLRSFREAEDARFIALTLPRILMRLPYEDDGSRTDGFRFREAIDDKDGATYLWGNAPFAFASVVIRAFGQSGWLSDIRGVEVDRLGGGLVVGLPLDSHDTDRPGLVTKSVTDVQIGDGLDKDLAEFGLLSLSHCKDTAFAAFFSSPTVQKPKVYSQMVATTNARLSATLQHVLCTSRFAHYLKVMAREKIGTMLTAEDVERYLNTWLLDYCTSADDASAEIKARYPLREGSVQVRERSGRPGDYLCTIHLRPHFQFDQVISSVALVTQLSGAQTS